MQELKITKAIVNERKELVVSFICKEWDYTEVDAELLRQAKNQWDLLDLEFKWFIRWDIEKQNKKNLVRLNLLMIDYCEKSNSNMEDECKKLYNTYTVKSRRDISPSHIEAEIECYKMWILEFN